MFAPDYLLPRGLPVAEFAIVLVFAMTGRDAPGRRRPTCCCCSSGSSSWSCPATCWPATTRPTRYSTEGAIKYFLLGSFSSAIFLFGLAFVWGMTGTTLITRRTGSPRPLAAIVAGDAPLSPGWPWAWRS